MFYADFPLNFKKYTKKKWVYITMGIYNVFRKFRKFPSKILVYITFLIEFRRENKIYEYIERYMKMDSERPITWGGVGIQSVTLLLQINQLMFWLQNRPGNMSTVWGVNS